MSWPLGQMTALFLFSWKGNRMQSSVNRVPYDSDGWATEVMSEYEQDGELLPDVNRLRRAVRVLRGIIWPMRVPHTGQRNQVAESENGASQ